VRLSGAASHLDLLRSVRLTLDLIA